MTEKLRIGLIGAGNIAQVAQLPSLSRREDVVIAGVVTRTPESAQKNLARWPIAAAYKSAAEMISDAALDAVMVLTPRGSHFDDVRVALHHDLDVFCEKPLSSTSEQCEELVSLAREKSRVLMVNFNRRYAPGYRAAKEAFGPQGPNVVVAQKNRRGSEYRASFENAIHMIDLLRFFCGEAAEVTAHYTGDDPYHEAGLTALVKFESGALGTVVGAREAGGWDERLEAYGGMCSARVLAPNDWSITKDGVESSYSQVRSSFGWATATDAFGFSTAVDEFLDSMLTRQTPSSDGVSAWRTQLLLERILRAAGLPDADEAGVEWASHAVK